MLDAQERVVLSEDRNTFPQFLVCGFCKDKGLTLDEFNGFRFCTCPAGVALARQEPFAAVQANAARDKLRLIGKE